MKPGETTRPRASIVVRPLSWLREIVLKANDFPD